MRLQIENEAFADAMDWLGGENLKQTGGKWIAEVTLPNEDGLARKLLSFGSGVKVLSPLSLKEKIVALAKETVSAYL